MVEPLDAKSSSVNPPASSVPPKKPPTVHLTKPSIKKETSRIELSDAESPMDAPGETLSISEALNGFTRSADADKSSTSRIHLTEAEQAQPNTSVPDAKDSTARIVLGGAVGRTSGGIAGDSKDATVRLDLTGLVETGVSSGEKGMTATASQTSSIDVPGVPLAVPPKTVRLQRSATSPKTVVLRRPGETAAPQTVVLQRPAVANSENDSAKGATARISIPDSVVQTQNSSQRKTIMIKRPGQGGLVLQKPMASAEVDQPSDLADLMEGLQVDEPGAIYSVLALVAVLLLAVLLYVLAAQTIAQTLPFPGRII